MYGKLFRQMYDSTLAEDWRALITFQQLIILCDEQGVVDMTPGAISRTTNIPLDIIEAGIQKLEQPDQLSRSTSEDGRRIIRLDDDRPWGWRLVNYLYYRSLASKEDKREKDRLRIAEKRSEIKYVADSRSVSPEVVNVAHTEEEADTEAEKKTTYAGLQPAPKLPNCPKDEIVNLYHEFLPMCPRVQKWTDARERLLRARWREHPALDLWKQYFAIVKRSKFLTGKANSHGERRPFLADFEWLIKPGNFVKVLEGRYDDDLRKVS